MFNIYALINQPSGAVFDHIDLFFNIKDIINTKFKLFVNKKYVLDILKFMTNSYTGEFVANVFNYIHVINNESELIDIILNEDDYDISLIQTSLMYRYLDERLFEKYKKIYSIASLHAFLDIFQHNIAYMYKYPNFTLLSSPFIKPYLDANNIASSIFKEYYVKFSKYRLDNIKMKLNEQIFWNYKNYEFIKLANNSFNIHDYNGVVFHRRNDFLPDYYLEMKGKIIFEFLYFNKYVYYSAKTKQIDDGLTDYLRLFNIDDNISQKLNITSKEIFNKLVRYDETDPLVRMVLNDQR